MNTQLLAEFPELGHLSRQDLEDLLTDQEYFQAVFMGLPRVQAMLQSVVELGRANEAIANKNLSLRDSLFRLRSETQQAFDEAKALEARSKQLEREQKELHQRYTASFLLMRLRHATTALEEQSESTATSFVQGTPSDGNGSPMDVEDFIRTFKEQRVQYHKRAIWGEQWAAGKVTWPEH
ncbi:SubName: Full=Uncharacterized protein {ECO:0000313/EMBL:CCA72525.1} [Serendipita indica DSM 11827]|uniref:VPS37 C-terminal domain-containing protein n=1 Tax=Serendipita indica (strain DSM 11827) TaxID=1109443 RepID=G4TMJ1_SERID|nr:SubName: Full=Uncharacterized protein {ECO:0000313/EMBL:CCA72525.1} [Serendipita indica DSM 11827]CCA72525.1 hypothetical protein PIIN_06462 [Serendipita indica DSM 11827]